MEFKLAVEWGMTEQQALIAGTKIGAEVLGVSAETGSIEVGRDADFVAFAQDPLIDVSALRDKPVFVMHKGISIL